MKVNEIIKKLRMEAGLTQEQFGRLIYSDGGELTGAAISQYESGKRKISIELLERMLEVFGYTLELKLVDKVRNQTAINFYKPKTGEEVISMSINEQVEYIFVSLSYDKWARILKISTEQLELMPLDVIKILLENAIKNIERNVLKYIIDEEYLGYEEDFAHFIEEVKHHLYNDTKLPKDVLDEAIYFGFDIEFYFESKGEVFFDIYNFKLLDKYENEIPLEREDIEGNDGCAYIDYSYEVGAYMYHSGIRQVKIK